MLFQRELDIWEANGTLCSVDISCLVLEKNDSFQHFGGNSPTMPDLECVLNDRYSVHLVIMTSVYVIILPTSPWEEGSEEAEQTSWAHGNRGKCENQAGHVASPLSVLGKEWLTRC